MSLTASLLVADAIIGGISAHQQGNQQANQYRAQARREGILSELDEKDFRRRQSKVFGEMFAAGGRSGIDMTTGSALLAAGDFAAETELNALKIRMGGQMAVDNLKTAARYSKQAGRAGLVQGGFRAGATLLTGFSDFNGQTSPQNPTTQWT